jgi:2'-5' RNA ligase
MPGTGKGATLRLFVALELPEPTRRTLTDWATAELSAVEGVRLPTPGALHLTLCFLGATPASELDAICAACHQAFAGHAPAQLSLGSAVALPRRRPRVIAIRVGGTGAGRLADLQSAVSARMAAGGWYRPESRAFLAHVTLARVRAARRIAAPTLDRLGAVGAPAFVADTVTLFRSDPGPGGSRYRALLRVVLAAVG